jgi:competence protein ComEC
VKTPAVAIAAAFVCGIAVGLRTSESHFGESRLFFATCLAAAILFLLLSLALLRFDRLASASAASLLAWIFLGVLSAAIASQPLAANHIARLVEDGQLNLGSPLRWHGLLRDEPARLPSGTGFDVDLIGVEYAGTTLPVRGGMRVSFTPHSATDDAMLPSLHSGDAVEIVAQAKRPPTFRDEGAFDRRAYLASKGIDIVASLRSPTLITFKAAGTTTPTRWIDRARRRLRDEVDTLFSATPQVAAVLRAMLLGDRTFVDREESVSFQKTGVFHILVVAGLHVGALAALLFWVGRSLRLSPALRVLFVATLLAAYVAIVEQRAPVLRAAMMAALVLVAGSFFRRIDLLNSAASAAVIFLVWRPLALRDSSFQLTFVAMACIGGLAIPWLDATIQPYAKALRGWRDVTRDASHDPQVTQFRLDVRASFRWTSARFPSTLAHPVEWALYGAMASGFRLSELFILTVVLQLGMLPLMATSFHRITLTAPLVNLFAVPVTGVIVPFGFLTLAAGLVSRGLGKIMAAPLAGLTTILLNIVKWFAAFAHWSYRIPGPPRALIVFFFASALAIAIVARFVFAARRIAIYGLVSAWLAAALLVAIFPFSPVRAAGKLEASLLDVGQGDSVFIVSPSGKTMLIDGGGAFAGFPGRPEQNGVDPGEEAVSPYLWSRGFKTIDVVALTHAHQDHLGGLTAVLENFRVGQLWIGREVGSRALTQLEELAHTRGTSVLHEIRGQKFEWGATEGEFLWPDTPPGEITASPKNNDSLVLRLRYGNRTLLLPGDAEKAAEHSILAENDEESLHADILKVGHHGSKNSTMPDFLAAVRPKIAIISSGEGNPYGHPSPELLERLERAGIRVLRTDTNGAIHVLTDGERIEVSCFVACPGVSENSLDQAQIPLDHKHDQQ